ncbi:relaxase/mobilization nuclease domain-containing protein [Phenylobacterium sp. VNQ135]|uniref:relaxase/mobilization nuclease domain-containing protein n=1 Tax=Phenylobacterium sp. VNQ135 TaxID=3400922 RepID=UPI003C069137
MVKARVVRQRAGRAPLATHLDYLQREGVTRDGDRGRLFDATTDEADANGFAGRCEGDRHHFRFIISPDDAEQLSDLKAFTRDLMGQAEADLGTRLDWVAVDHWNTAHPHLHVIVRGRTDEGEDLVIAPDYIREGLRARAGRLVTLELGPRTDGELKRQTALQIEADRWTALDRGLARLADEQGVVDMRPAAGGSGDLQQARLARLRKLRGLGLADEVRPGRWRVAPDAEAALRALGQRQDVIARLHRALSERGLESDPARFVLDGGEAPLVGRLCGRGLDDELRGSGYAIVEGLDGCTHHVRFADLDDASDAPMGGIVEVRRLEWQGRRSRLVLQVRSDLGLADQVRADGATWLDRQLVGRAPADLGEGGFASEVRAALNARGNRLVEAGLAQRQGRRLLFARDLLETLRQRELAGAAARLADQTGLKHQGLGPEGVVAGTYRQRVTLASGRFAMIDNGLGFTLVPWRPELERHLGRHVDGVLTPGGGMTWSFSPKRGLGR